jgi:hypothetical protein
MSCSPAHNYTSCPVTTQIARSRSLTCSEESLLTTRDSKGVRFTRFIGGQVAACDNEACPVRSLASVSGRLPDCTDARAGRRSTVNRGKLIGRGCRTRTIQWQEGKFIDRGHELATPALRQCRMSLSVPDKSACCQSIRPVRASLSTIQPEAPSAGATGATTLRALRSTNTRLKPRCRSVVIGQN